jgi:hypothetical protein
MPGRRRVVDRLAAYDSRVMRDRGAFVGLGRIDGVVGTIAVRRGIEVRLIRRRFGDFSKMRLKLFEVEDEFAAELEFVMIAPLPVLLEFLPGPSSQLI